MLNIVVELVEKHYREGVSLGDGEAFHTELAGKGYTPEEIDRALSWIARKFKAPRSGSLRIFSPFEKSELTTDGHGVLLKLRNLGLLSDEHIELIMARSILLGEGPIDAEGIRSIATVLLFDLKEGSSGFSLYIDTGTDQIVN